MMKKIVLCAGGTGGHINAAIALGDKILAGTEIQNFTPLYISGQRPLDYKLFKGKDTLHLNVQGLGSKRPIYVIKTLVKNLLAFIQILKLFVQERPAAIIGAGGYVCGPVLIAGFFLGVPLFILEQNSVAGLTNKILSFFVEKVFIHFAKTDGFPQSAEKKLVLSGNPIRREFYEQLDLALSKQQALTSFNILVFGGSLGATSINEMIRNFLPFTSDLNIKHQVGSDSKNSPAPVNVPASIKYETYPYFDKIIEEYIWSNLLICRAGASTVAELRLVRKPVLLIPYPYATHNHQWHNAKMFQAEADFPVYVHTVEELSKNNYELLLKIIQEQKMCKTYRNSNENRVMVAENIILKEVKQYV